MATGGRGGGGGKIKNVTSDSEFTKELITAGDRLVVVNFCVDWGEPCKKIAPVFERLSGQHTAGVFIKLDTDLCRSTARRYGIEAMPTFIFFKNREKIHEVKGANEDGLKSGVIQHLGSQSETTDSSGASIRSTITVPGQINLSSLIDHNGSECLNESDDHPFSNCLKPDDRYLESDCDDQLILVLAFTQSVKLHTLQIIGPSDGRAPKTVRLFINQPQTIDFDAAEHTKPIQELNLTEDDVKEDSKIPLQYVKYQNVQNLTIYVKDSQGSEETTVVQYLGLFGSPVDTTNMKEFKRVVGEKGERHA